MGAFRDGSLWKPAFKLRLEDEKVDELVCLLAVSAQDKGFMALRCLAPEKNDRSQVEGDGLIWDWWHIHEGHASRGQMHPQLQEAGVLVYRYESKH